MIGDKMTLSVPEAAKLLGIGKNLAYLAVQRGEIPSIKVGGRLLIPRVALEQMLAEANGTARTKPERERDVKPRSDS